MKEKLQIYGFPDFIIVDLLKGRTTLVVYGKVKLNRKTGVLTTIYDDGKVKKVVL